MAFGSIMHKNMKRILLLLVLFGGGWLLGNRYNESRNVVSNSKPEQLIEVVSTNKNTQIEPFLYSDEITPKAIAEDEVDGSVPAPVFESAAELFSEPKPVAKKTNPVPKEPARTMPVMQKSPQLQANMTQENIVIEEPEEHLETIIEPVIMVPATEKVIQKAGSASVQINDGNISVIGDLVAGVNTLRVTNNSRMARALAINGTHLLTIFPAETQGIKVETPHGNHTLSDIRHPEHNLSYTFFAQ